MTKLLLILLLMFPVTLYSSEGDEGNEVVDQYRPLLNDIFSRKFPKKTIYKSNIIRYKIPAKGDCYWVPVEHRGRIIEHILYCND